MTVSANGCTEVSPSCPVEDTLYGYTPNLGGNAFYAVVFAVCALANVFFILRHWKLWKGYSVLVCIGCVGECCGYVARILLHKNPWDGASTSIQFVLLMVSPSFLAAALYMTLRTLVQYFGPKHSKLPARLWTWPFVTADLIGFLSQCGGGIMASGGSSGNAILVTAGRALMIAGVAFQAVIMLIAGALATDFTMRMCRRQSTLVLRNLPKDLKIFLCSMIAAFILILARCIYRIPEMAGGIGGPLMREEAEFMIFDGLLIMLSVVLLSIAHPGIYASDMQDGRTQTCKTASQPLVNKRGSESGVDYGYDMERH